jgi:hypothetical protein
VILPEIKPLPLQVLEDVFPGNLQQRANQERFLSARNIPRQEPHRWHAGQPFRTTTTQQPHQHRLHLIAAVMSDRNLTNPLFSGHLGEELVPSLTSHRFEIP